MTTRLLVAVSHDVRDNEAEDELMSPYCVERAKSELAPLTRDRSLLLVEGFNHDKIVFPTHPNYHLLQSKSGNWLGESRPAFGGFDHRQGSVEECFQTARRYNQWEKLVKQIVLTDWSIRVNSLQEARSLLQENNLPVRLSREITREEVNLASWILLSGRKFDRSYLEKMSKYGHQFDTIMFIGGSTHALSMSLKSSYPLIDLTKPEDATQIYYAYMADYYWPRLFLDRST